MIYFIISIIILGIGAWLYRMYRAWLKDYMRDFHNEDPEF